MNSFVKVDAWLAAVLVDPLSKTSLHREQNSLISDYGARYPIVEGIYDLRLLKGTFGQLNEKWAHGQREYEGWARRLAQADREQDYLAERERVREVYKELPIVGRCIDVGGHQGRLRAYLGKEQQYASVDPFLNVFSGLDQELRLLAAFPELSMPVNFLCAFGEHLPLASNSFDTVHMRSCIDHLMNPELALRAAYRVLRDGGQLILGTYVEGGKIGRPTLTDRTKHAARSVLAAVSDRFADHHVWHPTYAELLTLLQLCGFRTDRTHWQAGFDDHVCYVRAIKGMN
jgi:SAM-dependent methyltransferase